MAGSVSGCSSFGWHFWPFTTCYAFHHSLLAFKVSIEKSSIILRVDPLCYLWYFSFSFNSHSLFYAFNILVIICYGVSFVLLPLCASFISMSVSFLNSVTFSSTVSLKLWSMPFYRLGIPPNLYLIMLYFGLLIMYHSSCMLLYA